MEFVAGVWTAAAILTARAARQDIAAHEFSQLAILTSALMLFSSFLAGAYLFVDHPYFLRAGVASIAMTVLLGGAWLLHPAMARTVEGMGLRRFHGVHREDKAPAMIRRSRLPGSAAGGQIPRDIPHSRTPHPTSR